MAIDLIAVRMYDAFVEMFGRDGADYWAEKLNLFSPKDSKQEPYSGDAGDETA